MGWVDREVQQQVLDFHDIPHCIGRDGHVAGQGRLGRRLKIGVGALDQESDPLEHGVTSECLVEFVQVAQ